MNPLLSAFVKSPWPGRLYYLHRIWRRIRKPRTLGVRCIIRDAEGRFLLVRHTYRPGWFLPGGGVHKWETLPQAAIREAREETGISVEKLAGLFGVYAHFNAEICDHVALYIAESWARTGEPGAVEIAEHGFFGADGLPDGTSAPTRRRIAEVEGRLGAAEHW